MTITCCPNASVLSCTLFFTVSGFNCNNRGVEGEKLLQQDKRNKLYKPNVLNQHEAFLIPSNGKL